MRRLMRLLIRLLILGAVLAGAALIFGPKALDQQVNRVTAPPEGRAVDADTTALHQSLRIADLSAATTLWRRDLAQENARGHVDLPRLQKGNVTLQVFSVVTTAPTRRWLGLDSDLDGARLLAMLQLWPLPSWYDPYNRALVQARHLHQAQGTGGGGLRILRTRADLETLLRRKRPPAMRPVRFWRWTGPPRLAGRSPISTPCIKLATAWLGSQIRSAPATPTTAFRLLSASFWPRLTAAAWWWTSQASTPTKSAPPCRRP